MNILLTSQEKVTVYCSRARLTFCFELGLSLSELPGPSTSWLWNLLFTQMFCSFRYSFSFSSTLVFFDKHLMLLPARYFYQLLKSDYCMQSCARVLHYRWRRQVGTDNP